MLGKNRRPGVALLGGRIPVFSIIGQIDLNLAAFSLGLLQTKNVGLVRFNERQEQPLLVHGAYTVHVPGINLHFVSLTEWLLNGPALPKDSAILPPTPCRRRPAK